MRELRLPLTVIHNSPILKNQVIFQLHPLFSMDSPSCSSVPGWSFPGADSSALARLQEVTPESRESLSLSITGKRRHVFFFLLVSCCIESQTFEYFCLLPGILKSFFFLQIRAHSFVVEVWVFYCTLTVSFVEVSQHFQVKYLDIIVIIFHVFLESVHTK